MKTKARPKAFRLFKRADDGSEMQPTDAGAKDRPYYFRFVYCGKAYKRCLETTDATEAQKRAKAKHAEMVAAVSSGEYGHLDATKLRTSSSTLEELFRIPMKTKSRRNGFRLFKRADDGSEVQPTDAGSKDRPYYFRFVYRGKAYKRCLETTNATEAQKRAKAKHAEMVAAVSSGEYGHLDATKLRTSSSTLEELFAAYRTSPAEASAATRQGNICALKLIAGAAGQVRDLTPAIIRDYFETVTAKVMDLTDQQQIASLKRSANSRWLQARSLFTEKCLSCYQNREVIAQPDDLRAFCHAGNVAMFNRIPKQNYNPPSEATIAKTLDSWMKMDNRDTFLAIGHELAFGLRLSEMAQARWSWHTERNAYPVLDARAEVKNGSGMIQVRALDPFYTTMKQIAQARGWWGEGDKPIISGTVTYCTDGLFRGISAWLRSLGWETNKTNHALRAYVGSQVAMRYGIYDAQIFLRHSSVKVTEQNYSHFVRNFKPQDLDNIPARWAKVTPTQNGVTLGVT